jgi:hypothetical protein
MDMDMDMDMDWSNHNNNNNINLLPFNADYFLIALISHYPVCVCAITMAFLLSRHASARLCGQ